MARRLGSVYERKDGYWVAQYGGVYKYAKNKAEAKQKLKQLIQDGEQSKPQNITVSQFMDKWFDSAKPNYKHTTIKRYGEAINAHIKPNLGGVKLHKLDALKVESMYSKMMRDGLSAATVQLVHSVLSAAFGKAIKWNMLQHNVIKDVDAPKIVRDEVEVFTPSEVASILSEASKTPLEALWVIALSTGMRGGEILALEWKNANLAAGMIDIKQTAWRGNVGTPKSKKSRRQIQLPQHATDALRMHKKRSNGSRWVFPNKRGEIIRYNSFLTFQWKPLLERAGVRYKNFHTCRHYVASTLLSRGLPISAVARYLGHDEITLLRTYSHMLPDMNGLVAATMDSILG